MPSKKPKAPAAALLPATRRNSSSQPQPRAQPTSSADIRAAFGASGSGKSLYMKALVADERRLLVFDSMDEYQNVRKVRTARDLLAAVRAPQFRVAFVPEANDARRAAAFDLVCNLAFALGDVCLLVEEMKFVTRPSWAPMPWARITSQGRHQRLKVRGTSQRPASVDKDFFGNCTVIRCGRLVFEDDARVMSKVMRVPEAALLDLPPLHYYERELTTGETKKGVLHPGAAL